MKPNLKMNFCLTFSAFLIAMASSTAFAGAGASNKAQPALQLAKTRSLTDDEIRQALFTAPGIGHFPSELMPIIADYYKPPLSAKSRAALFSITKEGAVVASGAGKATRIEFEDGKKNISAEQIMAGDNHALALVANGEAYFSGANLFGQSGNRESEEVLSPREWKRVPTPGEPITQIAAYGDGSLFATGSRVYLAGTAVRFGHWGPPARMGTHMSSLAIDSKEPIVRASFDDRLMSLVFGDGTVRVYAENGNECVLGDKVPSDISEIVGGRLFVTKNRELYQLDLTDSYTLVNVRTVNTCKILPVRHDFSSSPIDIAVSNKYDVFLFSDRVIAKPRYKGGKELLGMITAHRLKLPAIRLFCSSKLEAGGNCDVQLANEETIPVTMQEVRK
jgi:hypothetical protein